MTQKRKINTKENIQKTDIYMKVLVFIMVAYLILIIPARPILSESVAFQWAEQMNSVIVALFVFLFSIFLYKKVNRDFFEEKQAYLFLSLAFLFRLLGEIFWVYYNLIANTSLHTIVADIMWYISYVLIFMVLGYQIKKIFIVEKKRVIGGVLTIATLFVLLLAFVIQNQIALGNIEFSPRYILLELYVVFDIYVIALFSILVYPMLKDYNKSFRPYLYFILGFFCFGIFDFFFPYKTLPHLLTGIVNFLYNLSYVFILFGLYLKYKLLHRGVKEI